MYFNENAPTRGRESRRQFIKKTGLVTAGVAGSALFNFSVSASDNSSAVSIVFDPTAAVTKQAPVRWAAEQLRDALTARGTTVQIYESLEQAPTSQRCILVSGSGSSVSDRIFKANGFSLSENPEALALARGQISERSILVAAGSDARGSVYALLELADRVNFAADPIDGLTLEKAVSERPANAIRSVGRAFSSDVEDLSWFRDRAFWSRYLTMLATNRFNRFNLTFGLAYDFTTNITDCYFHFAYPFLFSVPGYNVRAVPLPDSERDLNLETLRFISDETAKRGMHFQLGLWTHAYQWTNSPRANYVIEGLTPETQAPYCRDALRTLLTKCPNISGVTIRTHGESGVAEGNIEIWKTIFDGVAQSGRKVEIDLHAKGMNQEIIDTALNTGMPVNISPKFWAEHMGLPYMQGAIRQQEMPPPNANTGFFSRSSGSRSFLRYGYGDLLAENRRYGVLHRIWPGTQRVLLWGDPEAAAAYGRVSSFCGSNGVELYEPLFFKGRKGSGLPGGRDAYADAKLKPAFDFEKYDYAYRVWGRNFYNPDTDADGWRRLLKKQFGRGAESVENSLASAGKVLPLVTTAHCPSAANNLYWPEMYYNMAIVDTTKRSPYSDTPSPKRLGTVSPLDPEFFLGLDEFADELIKSESSGKYSPAWVAAKLDAYSENAVVQLRRATTRTSDTRSAEFKRFSVDAAIQAGLGRFFAAKFRAGVLFALYSRSNHRPALEESIKANRAARAAWAELADTAKNIYREDVTFGPDYYQRGHWLDRLAAMDEDIADIEKVLSSAATGVPMPLKVEKKVLDRALSLVLGKSKTDERPLLTDFHTPSISFRRGQPLSIVATVPQTRNLRGISGLRLRYRRVNQADTWQMIEMGKTGGEYAASIPAGYTDSAFPLQYHFQIRTDSGNAWLYPGLETGWNGQPYFVVRQA